MIKTAPDIIPYHKEPEGFRVTTINYAEFMGFRYAFESASDRFGIPEPRWVRLGKIDEKED